MFRAWVVFAVLAMGQGAFGGTAKVPILYSTDLFHPHADPDDHYDLACLFAMPEFDIRAVVLDLGGEQAQRCGRPAVEQLIQITGRKVPYAIGLSRRLRTRSDPALDEPERFQGAVRLILKVLSESNEKVTIFTTGSCRDVAAAFNRQPELLRQKVGAVYINIGRGPNEPQEECNVGYDPEAYLRMFESALPLYWCPCFGRDGYQTLYEVDQAMVVGACVPAVRNYFVYCLTRSQAEPIGFLQTGPHPAPQGARAMWCTAPMFHAAGRGVYERGPGDWVALAPNEAERRGLGNRRIRVFEFEPMRAGVTSADRSVRPALPEPPPGQLAAAYWGCTQDRVGTARPDPDGRPDCQVRVLGLPADQRIVNVVLTGPNHGRWEVAETGRWWRLACDRTGSHMDCFFQFWASGEHHLEVIFADGSAQSARFGVPSLGLDRLAIDLHPNRPTGWVFRAVDPRYAQILGSCLKNLLAELGR